MSKSYTIGEMSLVDYEITALIDWFMYKISQERRRELMTEFPQIYNKLYEREIVQVTHCDDGTPIGTDRVTVFTSSRS